MYSILKFLFLFLMLFFSQAISAFNDESFTHLNNRSFKKYQSILQNTVWVVPPSTLLAYEYISGKEIQVQDQTVWVINSFNQDYFFGDAYVALNGKPSSHLKLVGSVTPFGQVYIAFFPTSGSLLFSDVVVGMGMLKKIKGVYVFTMQMNSAQNNSSGLAHWSYMESVNPNDPYYQNLPSVNMSVPQFIGLFS